FVISTILLSNYLYLFSLRLPPPPIPTLFPYTTLFRSPRGDHQVARERDVRAGTGRHAVDGTHHGQRQRAQAENERLVVAFDRRADRKSTRLNSSHEWISYAVFCLKKKKN